MLTNSTFTVPVGAGLSGGGTGILGGSSPAIYIGAGGVTNAMLASPGLTINTGAGLSGGGPLQLGGTLSLANTGVLSVTASSPLSVSTGQNPNVSLTGVIPIANGGTNASSYTANQFLWYNGTSLIASGYGASSLHPWVTFPVI